MRKITSKSNRLHPLLYLQWGINLKHFSSENIKKLGNISDYAHLFFGEDFYFNALY